MENDPFYVEEKYNLPFTEENRNALTSSLRWDIINLKKEAAKILAKALRANTRAKEVQKVVEAYQKEGTNTGRGVLDKAFLSKIKKKVSRAKTECLWSIILYEERLNEINEKVRAYNKLQVIWKETNERLNPTEGFSAAKEFYVYPQLGGLESEKIFKEPNY